MISGLTLISDNMKEVAHKGRIVSITPELTAVEIISESACSACHAQGLCGASESVVKVVDVPTRGWDGYAPGDEVEVVLRASMGHKAVWLAYVIPLLLLVAGIMLPLLFGAGELLSGLCGIGAVAVYYLVLFLIRDFLMDGAIFSIRSITNK